MRKFKVKILKLLKENKEFRYTEAGLINLEKVLKRLNKHREKLVKLRQDQRRREQRI